MILDETIFEGLYYKYSDRLYNFAFRFVSDEHTAQDIVHEAYGTLWEKFEGKESDAWQALLFRIVRNRSIDTLRHQSSLRIVSLTDSFRNVCDEGLYQMDFAVNDSDRKTIYDELTANIHSIMGKLPDRCREVFMMSRFQNMKNKEIAAALKISEKAVEKAHPQSPDGVQERIGRPRRQRERGSPERSRSFLAAVHPHLHGGLITDIFMNRQFPEY